MTAAWSQRRVSAPSGDDVGVTSYTLDGAAAGPTVVVFGGVHGDEVGGILAAGTVTRQDWSLRCGRLIVVPVSHEAAYESDSRCSPLDGANLARSFPGAPDGSVTARLAWLLTSEFLNRADVVIDLHTAMPAADMPLFVGCIDDGTPHSLRSVELALAFGLDTLWTHPSVPAGRTLSVAHARGVPSLYAESPLGGVAQSSWIAAYVRGVANVLVALDMLDGFRHHERPKVRLDGDGDVDAFIAASASGCFARAVNIMDEVSAGQPIGRVLDVRSDVLAEVRAPTAGYVTYLRRRARVSSGDVLAAVTPERPATTGRMSDTLILEGIR